MTRPGIEPLSSGLLVNILATRLIDPGIKQVRQIPINREEYISQLNKLL